MTSMIRPVKHFSSYALNRGVKISTCRSFTLFNSWWKHLREDVNKSFEKNAQ